MILGGIAALLFIGGAGILWASTLEIPDISSFEERRVEQSTKIYDRTGEILLYDLHENAQRTIVPLDQVSMHIRNATVAIEDADFYVHEGIRFSSIVRAVLANLTPGGYTQGGSTITQQVVKNALLTQDKTITRKVKEWVLAIKLEQAIPKDRILEIYLNENPYGGTVYGIEEATQTFFGKPSTEVTIAEAAYLAALPQAPTYYSPYGNNREQLEQRKNLVLSRMHELSFITTEEYEAAKVEEVTFQPQKIANIAAPHFVFYVREYLENKYGKERVAQEGFRVITTLDWQLEEQAEAIVQQYALENTVKFNASNAAIVAMDPRNGEILVMAGSRDYFDDQIDGNFNIALAKRQPGSSFKPFVYAAALEKGYTPETVVFDLQTQFSTSCPYNSWSSTPPCYSPGNYDEVFRGPVTFKDALAQSINIPAVKALYLVGIDKAIRLARDMGISTLTNSGQYGLTLVLGGGEVTLLDMTGAYSVFANKGIKVEPTAILRIEDHQGNVIEENTPQESRVLPEQVALQISDMLSDNDARAPAFGQTSALHFPGKDVAVKTGTTNDYRDAWIMGYTPNIVIGAWAGNNDNSPMEKRVAGFIVAPLWNAFVQKVFTVRPLERFPIPEETPTTGVPPVLRGFWQGNESYVIDKISGQLATQYTPQETRDERVVNEVHSILYWIDKNNPRGPRPQDPTTDAQFDAWEYSVQLWKTTQGIIEGDRSWIPTGTDTVHTPENSPKVSVTTPSEGSSFPVASSIPISVMGTGTHALTKADFFINGIPVGTSSSMPFTVTVEPQVLGVPAGEATISVIVYDSVFNRTESRVRILLTE